MSDDNTLPLNTINAAAKAAVQRARIHHKRQQMSIELSLEAHIKADADNPGSIDMHDERFSAGDPRRNEVEYVTNTVMYDPGDDRAYLDGDFLATDLQQIADHMKKYPVTYYVASSDRVRQSTEKGPIALRAGRRVKILKRIIETQSALECSTYGSHLRGEVLSMEDEGLLEAYDDDRVLDWDNQPSKAFRLTEAGKRLAIELGIVTEAT